MDERGDLARLKETFANCDCVLVGAGAGLSTAAGFTYTGQRLSRYFADFVAAYGFGDMYSGGFYPYNTFEENWGFWSRYIWVNRYMQAPKQTYENLLRLLGGKEYFVLTTNVDHCFQKAGFAKERLFYTQGDYGLFQCSEPCTQITWDNEELVRAMILSQGFEIRPSDNELLWKGEPVNMAALMEAGAELPALRISSELVPTCPTCGKPVAMNLRADNTFVEDAGWHQANDAYGAFLEERAQGKVLFLELGVGFNTPGIVKYPFMRFTMANPQATYVCINWGQAFTHPDIERRSICIDDDIDAVISQLLATMCP